MASFGQLISRLFTPRNLPLRIYGKLPFAPEYRRLNTAGPVASAFCRWIDDGRAAWMQHSADATIAPSCLAVKPTERPEFVVAHIRDSRDSVGRPFPIAFFVTVPTRALGSDGLERWMTVMRLWRRLRVEIESQLARVTSDADFRAALAETTIALQPDLGAKPEALGTGMQELTIGGVLQALGYGTPEQQQGAIAALTRRAARWRATPETRHQIALECPSANGLLGGIWAAWLGQLPPRDGGDVQCIAPAGELTLADNAESIWLLTRSLQPSDFQLLTPQAATYGLVEPLLPRGGASAPASDFSLPDLDEPLLAWLLKLGGGD